MAQTTFITKSATTSSGAAPASNAATMAMGSGMLAQNANPRTAVRTYAPVLDRCAVTPESGSGVEGSTVAIVSEVILPYHRTHI